MKKTIPAIGNYAFWSYDRFPYLLGGPISDPAEYYAKQNPNYPKGQWHRGESVFVTNYAGYFKPLFCLNAAEGLDLLGQIDALRAKARVIQDEANRQIEQLRRDSVFHSLDPREPRK